MARSDQLTPQQVAAGLLISSSRFYQPRTAYLRPCAQGPADLWLPGLSGGDHWPDCPHEVTPPLTKLLSSDLPSSYRAAASELFRRLNFQTDRASIRRCAITHHRNPDTRYKLKRNPVKRWQAPDHAAKAIGFKLIPTQVLPLGFLKSRKRLKSFADISQQI